MAKNYHQEVVGIEKLVQLERRDDLQVPSLEFPDDPAELTGTMLKFFRELWYHHGYAPIKSPHDAAISLPSKGKAPPLLLRNRYAGLTDGQVLDREPYLTEYKRQSDIRKTLPFEKPDDRADSPRKLQDKKLQAILEHVPDYNGMQGRASYAILLPEDRQTPFTPRIHRSKRSVLLDVHYGLSAERDIYNLPLGDAKTPRYPIMPALASYLFVFGEAYQPDLAISDAAYLQRFQKLTSQIPLLLRGKPVAL